MMDRYDDVIALCRSEGIPTEGWRIYLESSDSVIYKRVDRGIITHTAYCSENIKIYSERPFNMVPLAVKKAVA